MSTILWIAASVGAACHLTGAVLRAAEPDALVAQLNALRLPDEFSLRRRQGEGGGSLDFFPLRGTRYDNDFRPKTPDVLWVFHIHGHESEQLIPKCKVNWSLATTVRNGELFPVVGEIYRWEGDRGKFVRIPDHPLTRRVDDPLHNFTVLRRMSLSRMAGRDHLSLELKGFERYFIGARSGKRIKISMSPWGDSLVAPKPVSQRNSNYYWLNEGDRIRTKNWTLTLKRVVMPDPADKNPGWADFVLSPGPEIKPDAR